MASSKGYLDFILDQLQDLPGVTARAMMGEFILYCRGKIVGGIYDDRLLVKPTPAAQRLLPPAAQRLLPAAPRELPYEGAKAMLLVEEVDDREFLCCLIGAIADETPSKTRGGKG